MYVTALILFTLSPSILAAHQSGFIFDDLSFLFYAYQT